VPASARSLVVATVNWLVQSSCSRPSAIAPPRWLAYRRSWSMASAMAEYLLSTSDPDLSPEDVALGDKNLLEAERGLRDLKSTLALRPVFHRLEPRIRAHVLLCWLALLLVRVAERRCDTTWHRIATELGRIHAVTLQGPPDASSRPPRPAPLLRACLPPAPSIRFPGSPT
jgi:hypothetical protein